MNNAHKKFNLVRSLNLPIGEYAITGSGPMGVRALREIRDIDLLVLPGLWKKLAAQYGVFEEHGIRKIVIQQFDVEIFTEGSFTQDPPCNRPTVAERIASADIIDGLPFESLENLLKLKKRMGREKDKKDIELIESELNSKQKTN